MIVETAFLERARAAIAGTGNVEHLIVVDAAAEDAIALDELERAEPGDGFDFEATWRSVQGADVLTLIYTSGTTGPPKGVQLTHANELAECRGIDQVAEPDPGGSVVSFLPHAHIADRGLSHYGQMAWGYTVTDCPDPVQVFAHVADCHPTFFGSVPRMWEKLKASLEAGIAAEPDEARRKGTLDAIELGLRKVRAEQAGEAVPDELQAAYARAEELVFSQIRAKLGLERCEWYMIGAAPCPLDVLEFFAAIGIPICEVWGMSELSSVATLVPRDAVGLGTVGPPIPGVEVRLADDGEVLVRGDTVMAGYRNQPQKTADTIDSDGWLHTGDIGEFDDRGYLKIIDRKKELIINAAGKNMSPANIEQQLKQGSSLIGQAVAIGDGRPYNVALVVLDPDAAAAFAARHELPRFIARGDVRAARGAGGDLGRHRSRQRASQPGRADQAVQGAARRLGPGRRRADSDDEAQAPADLEEVRRRDRGACTPDATARGRKAAGTLCLAWHSASTCDFFSSPSGGIARRRPHVAARPAPRRSQVRDTLE